MSSREHGSVLAALRHLLSTERVTLSQYMQISSREKHISYWGEDGDTLLPASRPALPDIHTGEQCVSFPWCQTELKLDVTGAVFVTGNWSWTSKILGQA